MKEIETKILNVDVDQLRILFNQLNFRKVKVEDQINEIFDFADQRLSASKGYARIRTVKDNINNKTIFYMTVKKMLSQEKYKVMEENEVVIADANEGRAIFLALGLQLTRVVKKYRESYRYKDTLVEIDINDKSFCPFPYIEVESKNEDELLEVIELLGYTLKDTTSKTMGEILQDPNLFKQI